MRAWLNSASSTRLAWRAARARAPLPSRQGRDSCALPGLRPPSGAYAVTGSLLPLGRIFSTSVCGRGMTCTDTSSPMRRGPSVCRSFHRADVAAYHHGDVAGADVFLAHEHDVGGLHHRIGRLDRPNETFGLDHSQGFEWHARRTLTDCGRCPPCDDDKSLPNPCRSQHGRSKRSISDGTRGERRFRSPGGAIKRRRVGPVHSARPDKV